MNSNKKSVFSTLFFITCCFIWISIILPLGVFESSITPKNGVLPFTFNWWESTSFQNHLCLGNYLDNEVEIGTVYTTYTYPFYFVNYIILAPIHHFFGFKYETAQNILPFLNVLLFALVLYQLRKNEIQLLIQSKNAYFLFFVFLLVGLLISNALPWISMLKNNLENFHLFIALLFCVLSIVCIKPFETLKKDKLFLIIGLLISMLTPIYFPAWLLCYIYSEEALKLRKGMLINVLIVVFSNAINYLLPLLSANSLQLKSSASGFLFRSGLNGSRLHFDSILSVIYDPHSSQEKVSTLLLLASTITLGKVLKSESKLFFKQCVFLLIPFLTTIIFFPQFSSIHMYFIELLLVIPCVFMLCYWLLNFDLVSKLKPKQYSLLIVFFALIIMSQLLEIAAHFALSDDLKKIITIGLGL